MQWTHVLPSPSDPALEPDGLEARAPYRIDPISARAEFFGPAGLGSARGACRRSRRSVWCPEFADR
jgi:hypothetical protein